MYAPLFILGYGSLYSRVNIFIACLDGGLLVFVDFAVDCRDFFETGVYVVDVEDGQVECVCADPFA